MQPVCWHKVYRFEPQCHYELSGCLRMILAFFGCQNFIFAKFKWTSVLLQFYVCLVGLDLWMVVIPGRWHSHLTICHDTVPLFWKREIWVTNMKKVQSNKTILSDILDFWCQLEMIRFVKTLSKRRMFVSFMKISACWLLHRLIKFNKICWEKRPVHPRPNMRTSFCRGDLKNT